MIPWERPVFDQPFELWREEGVLHLVLAEGAQVKVDHMKEFIRLVAALDRSGITPVLMDYAAHVVVDDPARSLLRRVCGAQGHPVAILVKDPVGRAQAELFKHVERPAFPFRIFDSRESAFLWTCERRRPADHVPSVDGDR